MTRKSSAFHMGPRKPKLEADYGAMWHWVRDVVWAAHYDLADLRAVAGIPGRQKGSRELEKLRLLVVFKLSEAGYSRADIADFLFVTESCISQRLKRWAKLQAGG